MADTMIKSMTGFGRCEQSEGTRTITIEMKSVNHRYLEAGIKMPKKLNIFEARMREVLKKYAQRGKIDIFISYEDTADSNVHLKYNSDLAAEYMNILDSMAEQFGKQNDITITSLSRYPEVITMQEETEDEEELWAFISKALENAWLISSTASTDAAPAPVKSFANLSAGTSRYPPTEVTTT